MQALIKTGFMIFTAFASCWCASSQVYAENTELTLDEQIITTKLEMLALGHELKLLEDDLLYPPGSKISFYLAKDVGKLFQLHNVKLVINDEVVVDYDYSPTEESGLNAGAVHNLFVGNYLPGDYQLRAILKGTGPHGRHYKRAVALDFEKTQKPSQFEIIIFDDVHKQQPVFRVKEIPQCRRC